ncbi:MAG: hypothetical protein ACRCYO_13915 [Bacteroidia bacterium]
MTKRKYSLTLFLCFVFGVCLAQENTKESFLSFELGGSGGLASINYERVFRQNESRKILWRVGFSLAPIDRNNGTVLVFPLMIHGVWGSSKHKLDVGIGQTISLSTKGSFFIRMPTSIGYRLEPAEKRYYWRFAYTPMFSYLVDFQMQHWGGIAFGYRLKS